MLGSVNIKVFSEFGMVIIFFFEIECILVGLKYVDFCVWVVDKYKWVFVCVGDI